VWVLINKALELNVFILTGKMSLPSDYDVLLQASINAVNRYST